MVRGGEEGEEGPDFWLEFHDEVEVEVSEESEAESHVDDSREEEGELDDDGAQENDGVGGTW